jgi:transposase
VDDGGPGRAIGRDALRLLAGLFGAWADLRADPTQRPRFVRRARQYQWRLPRVLESGQQCGCDKTANFCTALLKLWPALWTFVTVPGIEPTNNAAEQAIRPAVLWRKGSFGTQSTTGNRFVERLLSVAATCKQQDRSLLAYLTPAAPPPRPGALCPPCCQRRPSRCQTPWLLRRRERLRVVNLAQPRAGQPRGSAHSERPLGLPLSAGVGTSR